MSCFLGPYLDLVCMELSKATLCSDRLSETAASQHKMSNLAHHPFQRQQIASKCLTIKHFLGKAGQPILTLLGKNTA